MNRNEKIQFLKDVKSGKRSLRELEPITCYELIDEKNDLYADKKTGKIYTHVEVKEKIKKSVHKYSELNYSERIPDSYDFKNTLLAYFCFNIDGDEQCWPAMLEQV